MVGLGEVQSAQYASRADEKCVNKGVVCNFLPGTGLLKVSPLLAHRYGPTQARQTHIADAKQSTPNQTHPLFGPLVPSGRRFQAFWRRNKQTVGQLLLCGSQAQARHRRRERRHRAEH